MMGSWAVKSPILSGGKEIKHLHFNFKIISLALF
jgi:hypothetical protein